MRCTDAIVSHLLYYEIMKKRKPWDWLEFRQPAKRTNSNGLFVRLAPTHGEIYMNLMTHIRLGSPEAFVLLFDPKTGTIGLRPSDAETPSAVMVRDLGGKAYKVIRVRPFLHEHGIYTDRTVQFPTASIDEDGILCLNLRDRIATGRPVRKPLRPFQQEK